MNHIMYDNWLFQHKLAGASLLESIVASIVFLIIFMLALDVLPRLSLQENHNIFMIKMESDIENIISKYGSGMYPTGHYIEPCIYGNIEISVLSYRDSNVLQVITIVVRLPRNNKQIEIRQIVETQCESKCVPMCFGP